MHADQAENPPPVALNPRYGRGDIDHRVAFVIGFDRDHSTSGPSTRASAHSAISP